MTKALRFGRAIFYGLAQAAPVAPLNAC